MLLGVVGEVLDQVDGVHEAALPHHHLLQPHRLVPQRGAALLQPPHAREGAEVPVRGAVAREVPVSAEHGVGELQPAQPVQVRVQGHRQLRRGGHHGPGPGHQAPRALG